MKNPKFAATMSILAFRSAIPNQQSSIYFMRVICSLIIIVSIVLPISAKPVVTLNFYDTVTIVDTAIYLADICKITTASKEDLDQLRSVTIGQSAPPGFVRLVNSQDFVSYKLNVQLKNFDYQQIRHSRCVVKTSAQVKTVGDYTAVIDEHIRGVLKWDAEDWSYHLVNSDDSWNNYCAPSTVTVEGTIAPYAKGSVRLFLSVEQFGQIRRIPVVCKIKVVTPVVITNKSILRNSLVVSDACELQKTNITDYGIVPYLRIADVAGLKASRTISEGTVLNCRMVAPIPVIAKGESVTIEVKKGQVIVNICAIARENGGVGDNIWVENAQSHKLIYSRVLSRGKVTAL